MKNKIFAILVTLSLAGALGGCTQQQKTIAGGAIGAGTGALIGNAAGGSTGAIIGGVAGAGVGGYLGSQH